ncbi:hypothetical protein ARMSODRAFT_972751 [Armillaria solidipes]|uniref:Uncharacterized protein n=1 Tax=Armillaria solidipes TaxID=1076256 RepID=A0A2H3BMG4_9AGAR|nr:hypothetical protein ARMSODRAFT_972751 [Armillaria solidipes]
MWWRGRATLTGSWQMLYTSYTQLRAKLHVGMQKIKPYFNSTLGTLPNPQSAHNGTYIRFNESKATRVRWFDQWSDAKSTKPTLDLLHLIPNAIVSMDPSNDRSLSVRLIQKQPGKCSSLFMFSAQHIVDIRTSSVVYAAHFYVWVAGETASVTAVCDERNLMPLGARYFREKSVELSVADVGIIAGAVPSEVDKNIVPRIDFLIVDETIEHLYDMVATRRKRSPEVGSSEPRRH